MPTPGNATAGGGMNAIAGGRDGAPIPLRTIAAMPLGALGVGTLVSGSRRSWRPRSAMNAALPALWSTRCTSTPRDWSIAVSERLDPWSRGRPDGSCITPRRPVA